MAISRRRLEELTCQFLMMVETLSRESRTDVCDNLKQLSNVTEEELKELNFPLSYYQKEKGKCLNEKLKKRGRKEYEKR